MKVTHPDGPQGEILVSGPMVGIGYWNQPDLTKESFITDPEDGSRWYLSGQLANELVSLGWS